jgi:hypothetical protein
VNQGLVLANQGESNDQQVRDLLQLEYQRQLLELVQVVRLQQVQLLLLLLIQLLVQRLLKPLLDLQEPQQVYLQQPIRLQVHSE